MITDFYSTLVLKTPAVVKNSYGDPVANYVESNFEGMINQANSQEKSLYQQYPADSIYKLFCGADVPIAANCKVYDGQEYLVISEPKNTVGRNHHYKVMMQKIDV